MEKSINKIVVSFAKFVTDGISEGLRGVSKPCVGNNISDGFSY